MNIKVYDIETLAEDFSITLSNPDFTEVEDFVINQYRNDIYGLVKFIRDKGVEYYAGFNCISFDAQVITFILKNYEKWHELEGKEIAVLIYKFAQKVIDDTNYGLFPPYREDELFAKQIDLFRIHHYNNMARRCSLKWVAFSIDEDVEEMPIHHSTKNLTLEQIEMIKEYRRNDVKVTCRLFQYTIGNTDHPDYEGDKLALRRDVKKQFDIDALNLSDVSIGDEITKRAYCKLSGRDVREVSKLKGTFRKSIKLKFCIAKFIKFNNPQLQQLHKKIQNTTITETKGGFSESIVLNGVTYKLGLGGIHSEDPKRVIIPNDNEILEDWDVASLHPTTIIKNKQFPYHLDENWLNGYSNIRDERLEAKKLTKTSSVHKCIADTYKLALNGSYGRTNMPGWMYDPQLTMFVTITGQLALLMLAEQIGEIGIKVVSCNTDGILLLYPKEKREELLTVLERWQKQTEYELESASYKKYVQTSVNDYLAIKTDGSIKKKGDFLTYSELHKNKSRRIIPLAWEKYFVEGTPVEKTIKKHKNIFDFCIGVKASKDYHYELVDLKTGEKEVFHRLVRYYVSPSGKKLLKIKNPESEATGNEINECEAPDKHTGKAQLCKVYNIHDPESIHDIDYDYYIKKAQDVIDAIELKKSKNKFLDKNQLNLF